MSFTLENIANAMQEITVAISHNSLFVLKIIAALWILHLINYFIFRYRLNALGILPRSPRGLTGIFFFSFLHGNFNHLFFNSIPFFFLANLILINGHKAFYCISAIIIVISGLAIWMFGRRAIHIGASNLVMGYFGFLLFSAYYTSSVVAIILAIICIYYFGGLVIALLPGKKEVSWEGHVFGFLAGFAAVYLYHPVLTIVNAIMR